MQLNTNTNFQIKINTVTFDFQASQFTMLSGSYVNAPLSPPGAYLGGSHCAMAPPFGSPGLQNCVEK